MLRIILIALLTTFIGGLSQPAFASAYGLAYASEKWEKHSLVVCWGEFKDLIPTQKIDQTLLTAISIMQPKPTSEILKNKIQNKVQEQYTLENTGIEFIGWKLCTETPQADIIVVALQNTNSSIGEKLNELPFGAADIGKPTTPEQKRYVFIRTSVNPNIPSPEDYITQTALHEFGHTAALRHEHLQVEAINDNNCSSIQVEEINEELRNKGIDGDSYGPYDSQSIMNYCYIDYYLTNLLPPKLVKLSAADIHTLRCLYKPESELTETCKAKNPTEYHDPDAPR
jgi:hypothetical protein